VSRPVALVTGATSGIGWQTAKLLGQKWDIVAIGRRTDRLKELEQELKEQNVSCRFWGHSVDITDHKELSRVFQDAEWAPKLSVLVNNAGLALGRDPVDSANWSDWQRMVDVNLLGLMKVTQLCLPFLTKQPSADIVNVGSVAGRWTYPGGAVYCATKFAVRAFSEGIRMDLLGNPVRVCNIEPGMVETEFSQVRFGSEKLAGEVYRGMTALTAKDVAESIFWCLDRPKHVNIQEMVIYPTDQASVTQVHRVKGEEKSL